MSVVQLLYSGRQQNEFLRTQEYDKRIIAEVDNDEIDCNVQINLIAPKNIMNNNKFKFDKTTLQFDMKGDYDRVEIAKQFRDLINLALNQKYDLKNADQLKLNLKLLEYSNQIEIEVIDAVYFTFQTNDYWLCKILGCIKDKIYQVYDQKITFENKMFTGLARTLNVISYHLQDYNFVEKGVQRYLLLRQAYNCQPGENYILQGSQKVTFSSSQLQSGFMIQFCDENYIEIPLEDEYKVELQIGKGHRKTMMQQEAVQIQQQNQKEIKKLYQEQFKAYYDKLDRQYQQTVNEKINLDPNVEDVHNNEKKLMDSIVYLDTFQQQILSNFYKDNKFKTFDLTTVQKMNQQINQYYNQVKQYQEDLDKYKIMQINLRNEIRENYRNIMENVDGEQIVNQYEDKQKELISRSQYIKEYKIQINEYIKQFQQSLQNEARDLYQKISFKRIDTQNEELQNKIGNIMNDLNEDLGSKESFEKLKMFKQQYFIDGELQKIQLQDEKRKQEFINQYFNMDIDQFKDYFGVEIENYKQYKEIKDQIIEKFKDKQFYQNFDLLKQLLNDNDVKIKFNNNELKQKLKNMNSLINFCFENNYIIDRPNYNLLFEDFDIENQYKFNNTGQILRNVIANQNVIDGETMKQVDKTELLQRAIYSKDYDQYFDNLIQNKYQNISESDKYLLKERIKKTLMEQQTDQVSEQIQNLSEKIIQQEIKSNQQLQINLVDKQPLDQYKQYNLGNYYYDKNYNIYKKVNDYDYELIDKILIRSSDKDNKMRATNIYQQVINNQKKIDQDNNQQYFKRLYKIDKKQKEDLEYDLIKQEEQELLQQQEYQQMEEEPESEPSYISYE